MMFTSALKRDPRLRRPEVVRLAGLRVPNRTAHARDVGVASVEVVREEAAAHVERLLLFWAIICRGDFLLHHKFTLFDLTSMSTRTTGESPGGVMD